MLGNFSYCNPTKLYFGEDALQNLSTELICCGLCEVAVRFHPLQG